MPTESCPELSRVFAEYNARYFRGHLPLVDTGWTDEHPDTCGICFTHSPGGECRQVLTGTILVNVEFRPTKCIWRMTLLHEMVHWKLRYHRIDGHYSKTDRHGHAFQREMKRLANIGAFRTLW